MQTRKAHRLWIASALTLTVLIGVTAAVMKQKVAKNDAAAARETGASAGQLSGPSESRIPTFSNLGIHEFTRSLVKGLPVSATVVMERVQTSADGQSTTRTEFARVYRDSEGRTRHEELGEAKGAEDPLLQDPLKATINDPAVGVSFVIDPKTNSARRKPFVPQTQSGSNVLGAPQSGGPAAKQKGPHTQILPVPGTIGMDQGLKASNSTASPNAQHESLGRRQVEGLAADGTRIVMTVPAGARNNEREIRIGCERWYSSSLKTLILIECSDSRYGKSSYRLTQIKTQEPAANLFTIPIKYKVQE